MRSSTYRCSSGRRRGRTSCRLSRCRRSYRRHRNGRSRYKRCRRRKRAHWPQAGCTPTCARCCRKAASTADMAGQAGHKRRARGSARAAARGKCRMKAARAFPPGASVDGGLKNCVVPAVKVRFCEVPATGPRSFRASLGNADRLGLRIVFNLQDLADGELDAYERKVPHPRYKRRTAEPRARESSARGQTPKRHRGRRQPVGEPRSVAAAPAAATVSPERMKKGKVDVSPFVRRVLLRSAAGAVAAQEQVVRRPSPSRRCNSPPGCSHTPSRNGSGSGSPSGSPCARRALLLAVHTGRRRARTALHPRREAAVSRDR